MSETFLITEQASARVLRVDAQGRVLSCWAPPPREDWGLPNEVKRRSWRATPLLLVTDSYGFVGAFDEAGAVRWCVDVSRAADPHSIELLPAGALAVAGAQGDWVRIYRGLSGADELLTEAHLPGAHGLAWDERTATLWAIGHHHLLSWMWDGHELRETSRRALPTAEGHDLSWSDSTHDVLWLTTRSGAYAAHVDGGWGTVPEGIAPATDVKSLGRAADGRVIYTRADERWWTERVQFLDPTSSVHVEGARIYKARWEDMP